MTAPSPPRFASLAALRGRHAELLRAVPSDGPAEGQVGEVTDFLRRAAAPGAILAQPADREAAQGLLDYWKASLYTRERSARPPDGSGAPVRLPPAVLADYDAAAVRSVAAAADRALEPLSAEDRDVARRVLLALVPMGPEGPGFAPAAAPRAKLEALAPPEQVARVVDRLAAAGALRLTPEGQVELAYEALARECRGLKDWLDKRRLFRDAALFWEKHNHDRGALFVGTLLDEALRYRDLNPLEQEFIAACQAEAGRL